MRSAQILMSGGVTIQAIHNVSLVLVIPMVLLLSYRLSMDPSVASPTSASIAVGASSYTLEDFDCPPCKSCQKESNTTPDSDGVRVGGLVKLSPERPVELKQVFFSGDSWIVLCKPDKATVALEEKLSLAVNFIKASSLDAKTSLGHVDCSAMLPSGKTIYQRFKLDPEVKPTIFAVAHGNKPVQAPLVFQEDALTLGWWMWQRTRPRIWRVRNNTEMVLRCLKRKSCVMLWNNASVLAEDDLEMVLRLHQTPPFRRLHFVYANSGVLRLVLEPKLPLLNTDQDIKVVFFKHIANGSIPETGDTWEHTLGMQGYKGVFEFNALSQFLSQVQNNTGKMTTLTRMPIMTAIQKEAGERRRRLRPKAISAKTQQPDTESHTAKPSKSTATKTETTEKESGTEEGGTCADKKPKKKTKSKAKETGAGEKSTTATKTKKKSKSKTKKTGTKKNKKTRKVAEDK